MDDPHCRHVVDARVKACFVEENKFCLLGCAIEGPHLIADIGSCDQVLLMFQAELGHGRVVDVREKADREVMLFHKFVQLREVALLLGVQGHGFAVLVSADQCLRLANRPACDRHLESMLKKIYDHGFGNQSCAEYQYFLHFHTHLCPFGRRWISIHLDKDYRCHIINRCSFWR